MTGLDLLESSTIRYYVYDDDKLVLSDIREKAIQDAQKTWIHVVPFTKQSHSTSPPGGEDRQRAEPWWGATT
jgi:hypothetical protein